MKKFGSRPEGSAPSASGSRRVCCYIRHLDGYLNTVLLRIGKKVKEVFYD